NSSVSTRSSSPAPSTPVASSTILFSTHNSPNSNLPQLVEKSIDQSAPSKKRRQKQPRPIAPLGPLPNQQPVTTSTQSQSNVSHDAHVFVQYVVPTTNPVSDTGSQLVSSKPLTRPRKDSIVNGVVPSLPSSQRRSRKLKEAT
ncbi:11859_t:CDS:1, partial [Cetraspora pellucida]